MYEVRMFPLYDDDGKASEVVCAAFDHPLLAVAMREAGVRAESWLRTEAVQWQREEERGGPVVGYEAQITARLASPLLPGHAESASRHVNHGQPYAPPPADAEDISTDADTSAAA